MLSPEEDKESNDIYSMLLANKDTTPGSWIITQETRGFDLCSKPTPDQATIYGSVMDDYVLKNRKTLLLERKFRLANYVLATSEKWADSRIAVFSAVGFNPDRTRAAVCYWAKSSGTCTVLVKMNGNWQVDRDWRGNGCGWAA